jgi:hypothetical protein
VDNDVPNCDQDMECDKEGDPRFRVIQNEYEE